VAIVFPPAPGSLMPVIFSPATTTSHPDVVPYISTEDYLNAPTAVDTSSLIPGGTTQQNLQALANVIRSASGWANNLCYQILAATLDTQLASGLLVRRDGTVRVVCDFWPVLELASFSAGPRPSMLAAVTATSDIWLKGRKVLVVPVSGLSGTSTNFAFPGPLVPGSRAYGLWSYWNGWPHAALTATAAQGATSLAITPALPAATSGRVMTIWDGANTEQVLIGASFTGGTSLPVPATLNTHTLPTAPGSILVSTLPDDVRQAVISLTSALIKTRGAQSYDMASVGQAPSKSELIEGGGLEDLAVAVDLLTQYRRAA